MFQKEEDCQSKGLYGDVGQGESRVLRVERKKERKIEGRES